MATYKVKHVDTSKVDITIHEDDLDNSTDLTLFGRTELNYGQSLNEDLLHLLENFACVENGTTGTPDLTKTTESLLLNPIQGQMWFNKTRNIPYVYDGTKWIPQLKYSSLAANWGVLADGVTIPLPVSPTGQTFTRDECSWVVSPFGYPNAIDYMLCEATPLGVAVMRYSIDNDITILSGFVNYLIVGIKGNVNLGFNEPAILVTPTPTPTPTISNTPTVTPTITITPSVTPTINASPTPTPTPVASVTPTPTGPPPSVTPTITVTPTVTPTMTPVASVTPTPTPSSGPPLTLTLYQGNGAPYLGGLSMSASVSHGIGACSGADTGKYAPGNYSLSQTVLINISGGQAPYTVTVDTWTINGTGDDMGGERFDPYGGGFTGTGVGGNALNNPTWTWTGSYISGSNIFFNGNGICTTNTMDAFGTATVRVVDNHGTVRTAIIDWEYSRDMTGGGGGGIIP